MCVRLPTCRDERLKREAVTLSPVEINASTAYIDLQDCYPNDVAVVGGICLPKVTLDADQDDQVIM